MPKIPHPELQRRVGRLQLLLGKLAPASELPAAVEPSKPKKPKLKLETTRLKDIPPEKVQWLWQDRIPFNKLTIIQGDPGEGKGFLLCDIMHRVVNGIPFCDGASCNPCEVLFATEEDGYADTIRPRMDSLAGNLDNIHAVTCLRSGKDDPEEALLDLGHHIDMIAEWLGENPKVRAVILDPLTSYLGDINPNHNGAVRHVLTKTKRLAEKFKVAFIGVMHLNKAEGMKAIYRPSGAAAFMAVARAAWIVIPDQDDPDRRLFLPLKNNLGKSSGLAYRLDGERVLWEKDPVLISANEAAAAMPSGEGTPRAEAREWLKELMRHGPIPAKDVERAAKEDGICFGTLKSAKRELRIGSKRNNGMWSWAYLNNGKHKDS